jgi:hypothetical protein
MIIDDERQSTARSCGRQCDRFARLEKGSLTGTPGLSERYPQESPKCPAISAKSPGDKAFYCSAMRTDFCDLLGIEHPIVAAPMGPDLTGLELVAAASNAGGLGILQVQFCSPPGEIMMVAAHKYDFKAAAALGLRTAFVSRPRQLAPGGQPDQPAPDDSFDVVAQDFIELAAQLGTRAADGGTPT